MSYFHKATHPEIFQGSLNKKNYFEGWYFKNVARNPDHIISFIPGVSLSKDSHAFIQVVDGLKSQTHYLRYPIGDFKSDRQKFNISIADNHFSQNQCELNLKNYNIVIKGRLNYEEQIILERSMLNPGIMGLFKYIPFLPTKHGVVSLDHKIKGSLNINGQEFDFTGGKGYIEKDWGTSFPEDYLWLQCNNFRNESVSLMFSAAKISWLGVPFLGFLGFLKIKDKIHRFATYNRSRIKSLRKVDNEKIEIVIQSKKLTLEISAKGGSFEKLKSPQKGDMSGMIKESITTEIDLKVLKNGKIILKDQGYPAGFEVHNKILDYFN